MGNQDIFYDSTGEAALAAEVIIGGALIAAGCAAIPSCRDAALNAMERIENSQSSGFPNNSRRTDGDFDSGFSNPIPLLLKPLPIFPLDAMSFDNECADEDDREGRCGENLARDLETCKALGKRNGKRAFRVCEQQAYLRYSNCLSGRDGDIDAPLPPWGGY